MSFYEYFQKLYVLRIHVGQHAGSMEREMCAYITGRGDGTHGTALAHHVEEEEEEVFAAFDDYVTCLPDESGFHRFATAVPSPEKREDGQDLYHSVGIFFSERPSDDLLTLASERALAYAQKQAEGAFDDIEAIAKYGSRTIEISGIDLVTYDPREGMEVLWKK